MTSHNHTAIAQLSKKQLLEILERYDDDAVVDVKVDPSMFGHLDKDDDESVFINLAMEHKYEPHSPTQCILGSTHIISE
jgi:hypothetical protein